MFRQARTNASKLLAGFLAVVMILSMVPVGIVFNVFAAEVETYTVKLPADVSAKVTVTDDNDAAKVFDYFTKTGRSIVLEGEKMLIANSDCKWQDFATSVDGEDYLRRFGNERITKIFIPHVLTQSELDAIGKKYLIYQHSDYAEFSAKNCTKATGMDLILKHCSIPVERSIAMGDSSNDIEMLKFAGICVAMGDGEKSVRDMCKIITAPAGEGGVADALERLLGV